MKFTQKFKSVNMTIIFTTPSSTPRVLENIAGSISALGMSNRKHFTVSPLCYLTDGLKEWVSK